MRLQPVSPTGLHTTTKQPTPKIKWIRSAYHKHILTSTRITAVCTSSLRVIIQLTLLRRIIGTTRDIPASFPDTFTNAPRGTIGNEAISKLYRGYFYSTLPLTDSRLLRGENNVASFPPPQFSQTLYLFNSRKERFLFFQVTDHIGDI